MNELLARENDIRYYANLEASGLCQRCGNSRGPNGTRRYCRPCSDDHSAKMRERYAKLKADGICPNCLGETGNTVYCRECRRVISEKGKIRRNL